MQIENMSPNDLVPYYKNPRINEDAVEKVALSIKEFGFNQPIVINQENIICAGHTRWKAAIKENIKTVPVYKKKMSEAEFIAYNLADNRTGEIATWDEDLKNELINDLHEMDDSFLSATGFDDEELEVAFESILTDEEIEERKNQEAEKDNFVPEVEHEPITKRGDVWLLGDHRVMCGDSTMIDDVDKLMDGDKADMVYTDPPYGISYQNSDLRGNLKGTSNKMKMIKNDDVILDMGLIFSSECLVYIWGANNFTEHLPERGVWHCWDKRSDDVTDQKNMDCCIGSQFELVWANKKSGYQRIFRVQHAGFKNADGGKRVHPTQKPTKLAEMCFEHEKIKESVIIADYFLGSGSTLIACEKTNRKCYGMELDEHYCDVIIERWQKYSNKVAVQEKTNEPYDKIKSIKLNSKV